ncbi:MULTISPECIES: hypothetical protein [unclassified Mucilaginibacter]|uniref:hypothetical protein n=1 Tax=unclassified Mucilaginibacter TaxID=2617802 RepID=UPI0009682356|nr:MULTISPECIES: hypothetical protein [unclassified Mucilaginibacter]HEK21244.1 hypothetical protein [Bacteroidota bacterium]OJW18264.1 MAG: hypothetical protein BGO48_17070 [Mucilaginibacter sp. 44-25]PAW93998.1 hypothetical protein CKK33_11035 [Mucilaginibacter sp. MD40]PLW88979.1 MAG: hypothetical protein C0154_13940 [Mucilaginibacter sp.]PMP66124.1 MAG: hypothetical protein C0191_01600 [Mucilaginibacter sp.]
MNIITVFGTIILGFALLLIAGVVFFSFLKYIKRKYYPAWKFPDYISVGYAEYLYHKYIRKDLPR